MPHSYIILDFETTGYTPPANEIIEIGALKIEADGEGCGKIIDRYQTLVRPKQAIPALIEQLTGITNAMVRTAPDIADVKSAFFDFIGDLPIVAHNAQMEKKFLDYYLPHPKFANNYKVWNSVEPIALSFPELPSYSLENLRKWASVVTDQAHRAEQDCIDTFLVLQYAHGRLCSERSHLKGIHQSELGQKNYFWNWFFEGPYETKSAVHLGDLKEFREFDESREVDFSKPIAAQEILDSLKSGKAGLEFRESQALLSQKAAEVFVHGGNIAVEAPTGTGKSIAYLLPGLLSAKRSGAPLVIATHSKALQDQLLEKDIPKLEALQSLEMGETSEPIRASVVKGQNNYLCLRKLNDTVASKLDIEGEEDFYDEAFCRAYLMAYAAVVPKVELDRVSRYLKTEFPFLSELIDQVRSHHTTTKGPPCPYYRECHFFNSAREAHQSDLIIANHSLVFHWPAHLPKIRNVVFDEAHHLEEQITEAFSLALTERELEILVDRVSPGRVRKSRPEHRKLMALIRAVDQEEKSFLDALDSIRAKNREFHLVVATLSSSLREGLIVDKMASALFTPFRPLAKT